MEKILSLLSPIKYYLLAIALAAYPAVFLWGDLHGKSVARLQDVQQVVKEDKVVAQINKKAAEAALDDESQLDSKINDLKNQSNATLPPNDDPCLRSPDRVRALQDLIDKANQ